MSLPCPKLLPEGKTHLDALLQAKLAEGTAPSIFWAATNANETIYENQAGNVVMGDPASGRVNRDSVLEIYSMTKLITSIAALQFVEKGVLSLDDPDQMYQNLPELQGIQVLEGYDHDDKAILVPQQNRITLRMLMDHTSGFVHPQSNPLLEKWYKAQDSPAPGILSTQSSIKTITAPLVFQPGTSYVYGSGLDWVGILISRLASCTLEEYFRQNVFNRVEGGMPDTTFYPRPDLVKRKVAIYQRTENGDLTAFPDKFAWNRPQTPETVSKDFLAGAGGLFGTTKDYLALLRAILQCDPRRPQPAQPLISTTTYKLLWEPSISCDKGKQAVATMYKGGNYLFFEPTPENVNHSVTFALFNGHGEHGRPAGSGGWSGVAHTHFWIDPVVGIAAVCNTQIIGSNPMPWNKTYNAYERALYENLDTA